MIGGGGDTVGLLTVSFLGLTTLLDEGCFTVKACFVVLTLGFFTASSGTLSGCTFAFLRVVLVSSLVSGAFASLLLTRFSVLSAPSVKTSGCGTSLETFSGPLKSFFTVASSSMSTSIINKVSTPAFTSASA